MNWERVMDSLAVVVAIYGVVVLADAWRRWQKARRGTARGSR